MNPRGPWLVGEESRLLHHGGRGGVLHVIGLGHGLGASRCGIRLCPNYAQSGRIDPHQTSRIEQTLQAKLWKGLRNQPFPQRFPVFLIRGLQVRFLPRLPTKPSDSAAGQFLASAWAPHCSNLGARYAETMTQLIFWVTLIFDSRCCLRRSEPTIRLWSRAGQAREYLGTVVATG